MKRVNIQEAKTHLSRLVEDVLAGEVVVIGRAGKPLVQMTPYAAPVKRRQGGQLRGRIVETADCWQGDDLADTDQAPLYPLPQRLPGRVAEE
jgi:prevent-host-death family protein